MGLHDASKPAGAIVEVFEDGDALRNDGLRLTAARKNPWYVLATVAGEQGSIDFRISTGQLVDQELHKRNRRIWHGWLCQDMNPEQRAAIAGKLNLSESEFEPLNEGEKRNLIARFRKSHPKSDIRSIIPRPTQAIRLENLVFWSPSILMVIIFQRKRHSIVQHFRISQAFKLRFSPNTRIFERLTSNFGVPLGKLFSAKKVYSGTQLS